MLLSFRPRRLYDTIHGVSNLADSDVRRLIENWQEILNDMKVSNYDAKLESSNRLMSRQASRFRDLPPEWTDGTTSQFWVWLKAKPFSHAQLNRPGSHNKQLAAPADGPFLVTKVFNAGVNFCIKPPEWMSARRHPKFNVKAIREVTDTETPAVASTPSATTTSAPSASDDGLWTISELTHRRYNKARDWYEYQCRWQGFARAEDEFRPESDIQADRLIAEYDAAHPRGATRGDRPSDIKSVLDSWSTSRSGRAIKRPKRLNQVHLIDSSASTDRGADLLFFSQPESCHTFSRDADFASSLDPGSLLFCGRPSSVPAEPRAVELSRRVSTDSSPHFREFRLKLRSVHWLSNVLDHRPYQQDQSVPPSSPPASPRDRRASLAGVVGGTWRLRSPPPGLRPLRGRPSSTRRSDPVLSPPPCYGPSAAAALAVTIRSRSGAQRSSRPGTFFKNAIFIFDRRSPSEDYLRSGGAFQSAFYPTRCPGRGHRCTLQPARGCRCDITAILTMPRFVGFGHRVRPDQYDSITRILGVRYGSSYYDGQEIRRLKILKRVPAGIAFPGLRARSRLRYPRSLPIRGLLDSSIL